MRPHRVEFRAMGSPCELKLYAPTPAIAEAAATDAIADVRLLEARYSRYRQDSLLSEINRVAARGGGLAVDEETAALLDYAQACHERSDGLFDVTAGVLRAAWTFDSGRLPDPVAVAALLPCVGWDKVRWQRPRLAFAVAGMELDFGGIVKEYAADRAVTRLGAAGIAHGLVNLGGDIRIIGPHPDGSPWVIGVRDPHRHGGCVATLHVREGAVASSGDYERCVVHGGRRYGHVLDPRTGWPVRGLAGVTVAGPYCVVAGSACTIAMLKGREGPVWLAALGLPHLWVGEGGAVGGDLEGASATES
jgi:thiamine biosynthesis lipoprotein